MPADARRCQPRPRGRRAALAGPHRLRSLALSRARKGAYDALLADRDRTRLAAVRHFNRYDLYTKLREAPAWDALRTYYEDLVAEFLPDELPW